MNEKQFDELLRSINNLISDASSRSTIALAISVLSLAAVIGLLLH